MSKGLEALENHKSVLKALGYNHCEEWENLKDIEEELKESENYKVVYRLEHEKNQQLTQANLKMSKALEIIKREPSAVIETITTYDTWEEYTKDYPISDRTIWHIIKNKEEYDLLKEVML